MQKMWHLKNDGSASARTSLLLCSKGSLSESVDRHSLIGRMPGDVCRRSWGDFATSFNQARCPHHVVSKEVTSWTDALDQRNVTRSRGVY